MTPTQLATLARAMGYEVEIDATGGYGVERVVMRGGGIFRPHDDAAQAWEVLAWLVNTDPLAHWELSTDGDGTADCLRRAIVDAAVRVAEVAA